MRFIFGLMLVALLTGCATNRAVSTASGAGAEALAHSAGPTADFDLLTVRVGVEFLPTEGGPESAVDPMATNLPQTSFRVASTTFTSGADTDPAKKPVHESDPVEVIALGAHARGIPEVAPDLTDTLTETWIFDNADEDQDLYEQITDRFYQDVMGFDGRQVYRQYGSASLLTRSYRPQMATVRNAYDDRHEDRQAQYDHQVLKGLVMGPLRRAMRKASVIAEFEADFHGYSGHYDQPTRTLEEQHESLGVDWGRPTARVHMANPSDPVEIGYRNFGFDVSSTRSFIRLGYRVRMLDRLSANVGWKGGYSNEVGDFLRADFEWTFDTHNYLHVTAGDELTYLGGPTSYTFLDSPIDGSRGVLFFVEHMF